MLEGYTYNKLFKDIEYHGKKKNEKQKSVINYSFILFEIFIRVLIFNQKKNQHIQKNKSHIYKQRIWCQTGLKYQLCASLVTLGCSLVSLQLTPQGYHKDYVCRIHRNSSARLQDTFSVNVKCLIIIQNDNNANNNVNMMLLIIQLALYKSLNSYNDALIGTVFILIVQMGKTSHREIKYRVQKDTGGEGGESGGGGRREK